MLFFLCGENTNLHIKQSRVDKTVQKTVRKDSEAIIGKKAVKIKTIKLISEHPDKDGKGMVEKRFTLSGASSVSDFRISEIWNWESPWEGETFLYHSFPVFVWMFCQNQKKKRKGIEVMRSRWYHTGALWNFLLKEQFIAHPVSDKSHCKWKLNISDGPHAAYSKRRTVFNKSTARGRLNKQSSMRMRAGPGKSWPRRAAWFRPKYERWIAVPTCPFTFDLFDLRPVAMITGRITFLRPAATATGRTAQSCTRFSDQNVYVTSPSMWEFSIGPRARLLSSFRGWCKCWAALLNHQTYFKLLLWRSNWSKSIFQLKYRCLLLGPLP